MLGVGGPEAEGPELPQVVRTVPAPSRATATTVLRMGRGCIAPCPFLEAPMPKDRAGATNSFREWPTTTRPWGSAERMTAQACAAGVTSTEAPSPGV